jgi:hypothetical protein
MKADEISWLDVIFNVFSSWKVLGTIYSSLADPDPRNGINFTDPQLCSICLIVVLGIGCISPTRRGPKPGIDA